MSEINSKQQHSSSDDSSITTTIITVSSSPPAYGNISKNVLFDGNYTCNFKVILIFLYV